MSKKKAVDKEPKVVQDREVYERILDGVDGTLDERPLYEIPFFAKMLNGIAALERNVDTTYGVSISDMGTEADLKKEFKMGKKKQTTFFTEWKYLIPWDGSLIRVSRVGRWERKNAPGEYVTRVYYNSPSGEQHIDLTLKPLQSIIAQIGDNQTELDKGFAYVLPTEGAEEEEEEGAKGPEEEEEEEEEEGGVTGGEEESTEDKELQIEIDDEEMARIEREYREEQEELERRRQEEDEKRLRREEEEKRIERLRMDRERLEKEKEQLERELETERKRKAVTLEPVRKTGGNTKPSAEEQVITSSPPRTNRNPLNTSLVPLRNLRTVLMKSRNDIRIDNRALVRLLNTFNNVHCSEISLTEDAREHAITPIYIRISKWCRVRRLSIKRDGEVEITMTAGDKSVYHLDLLDDRFGQYVVESLDAEPVTDGMTAARPAQLGGVLNRYTFTYDYARINPIFGVVRLQFTKTFGADTCVDSNGLVGGADSLMGVDSFRFEEKFMYANQEVKADEFVSHEDNATLTDEQRALLREYLFSSENDRRNLHITLSNADAGRAKRGVVEPMPWQMLFARKTDRVLASAIKSLQEKNRELYDAIETSLGESLAIREIDSELKRARADVVKLEESLQNLRVLEQTAKQRLAALEDQVASQASELTYEKTKATINADYYDALSKSLSTLFKFEGPSANDADNYDTLMNLIGDLAGQMGSARPRKMNALARLEEERRSQSSAKLRFGLDVSSMKKDYSETIRSNLFKGPYSIDLTILSPQQQQQQQQQQMDMTFSHINTFKNGQSGAFYGAVFDSVTPQKYRATLDSKLAKNIILSSGEMRVQVRDETGGVVKSLVTPFDINLRDQSGYLYLMEATGLKFFVKPIDATHMKLTMLAVDV